MTMKRKSNVVGVPERDMCQTPPYALDPLLPFLTGYDVIWEPAVGEVYIASALRARGWRVVESDILYGRDFFEWIPPERVDVIVTNPPYSIKYDWIRRCYSIGLPFALLMPLETLGAKTAQVLFEEHGMQLLLLNGRVNFKMPSAGWSGGGAQFPVAWFTYGLSLPSAIVYGRFVRRDPGQILMFDDV